MSFAAFAFLVANMGVDQKTPSQHDLNPRLPFEEPIQNTQSRRCKRGSDREVRESTTQAFEAFKKKRARIYPAILDALARRGTMTARELFRLLQSSGKLSPKAEIHGFRPRLSELADIGAVLNPSDPQRLDTDGHPKLLLKKVDNDLPALIWEITVKGRELLQVLEREARDQNRPGGDER